ncbi:MAG: hypothetical protein JNM63_05355, partial [Spirochaetia bacterium]|nr:hypothetical protein [Spirochaetia bacterium]
MKSFDVKVHDRLQCEFKFLYPLDREKRKTEAEIELFFFMPYNLGIDSNHYRPDNFYNDIQSYLRFSAPAPKFEDWVSGKSTAFKELNEAVAGLSQGSAAIPTFEHRIRHFGSTFKTVVKEELSSILNHKKESSITGKLEDFTKELDAFLEKFRGLQDKILIHGKNERVLLVYSLCDAYVSQMAEHYCVDFLERIRIREKKLFKKSRKILFPLIKAEIKRQRKSRWEGTAKPGQANEEILYNRSALKKFFSKVLFLRIHTKRAGFLLEQILFSAASALAMLFATVVAFWGQYVYGQLSVSFFLVLVLSYVFKDRLKELVRTFLHAKLTERLYDHAIHIFNNAGEKIGRSEESFNFLGKALVPREIMDRLPRDPFRLADADLFGEQAMVYRKRVTLFGKKIFENRSAY